MTESVVKESRFYSSPFVVLPIGLIGALIVNGMLAKLFDIFYFFSLASVVFTSISLILMTYWMIRSYPVIVQKDGILGYGYSKKAYMRWHEIDSVERQFPYIKLIYQDGALGLMIPDGWLMKRKAFMSEVENIAGSQHPLTLYLKRRQR